MVSTCLCLCRMHNELHRHVGSSREGDAEERGGALSSLAWLWQGSAEVSCCLSQLSTRLSQDWVCTLQNVSRLNEAQGQTAGGFSSSCCCQLLYGNFWNVLPSFWLSCYNFLVNCSPKSLSQVKKKQNKTHDNQSPIIMPTQTRNHKTLPILPNVGGGFGFIVLRVAWNSCVTGSSIWKQ